MRPGNLIVTLAMMPVVLTISKSSKKMGPLSRLWRAAIMLSTDATQMYNDDGSDLNGSAGGACHL